MAAIRTGAAYFGNRTLRHVRADLQDMADSGFDYVVHCFTESDLIYGIETMREIVRMSHELGMEAHMDPWGVAGIFGGEAFSKFVAREMDACQILADGSAVGIACLYSKRLRALLHRWIERRDRDRVRCPVLGRAALVPGRPLVLRRRAR